MRTRLIVGSAVFTAAFVSVAGLAYPEGAPAAHTGGFNEQNCGQCHYAGPPSGELNISGWPAQIEAGKRYPLEIFIQQSEAMVAGVQLSLRQADGNAFGRFIVADDDALQVTTQGGIEYLTHRTPQPLQAGSARWQLLWEAPASGSGEPIIHASAVVANDDQSPLGDGVLTLEQKL